MAIEPKMLFINVPAIPTGASFQFHPISTSAKPVRYRPLDLRSDGKADTDWMQFFEEILLGIYWKCGGPVPYAFRTASGAIRSLDAACIKWLLNRDPPEVKLHLDGNGYIDAVTPEPPLQKRYACSKDTLIAQLSWKKAAVS